MQKIQRLKINELSRLIRDVKDWNYVDGELSLCNLDYIQHRIRNNNSELFINIRDKLSHIEKLTDDILKISENYFSNVLDLHYETEEWLKMLMDELEYKLGVYAKKHFVNDINIKPHVEEYIKTYFEMYPCEYHIDDRKLHIIETIVEFSKNEIYGKN